MSHGETFKSPPRVCVCDGVAAVAWRWMIIIARVRTGTQNQSFRLVFILSKNPVTVGGNEKHK